MTTKSKTQIQRVEEIHYNNEMDSLREKLKQTEGLLGTAVMKNQELIDQIRAFQDSFGGGHPYGRSGSYPGGGEERTGTSSPSVKELEREPKKLDEIGKEFQQWKDEALKFKRLAMRLFGYTDDCYVMDDDAVDRHLKAIEDLRKTNEGLEELISEKTEEFLKQADTIDKLKKKIQELESEKVQMGDCIREQDGIIRGKQDEYQSGIGSTEFSKALRIHVEGIESMLLLKNKSYGNSALDPVRVFSRLNTREGLLVRIDDKLSRIQRGEKYPGDNDLTDLIGYLFLLKIALQQEEED